MMRVCGKNVFMELAAKDIRKIYLAPNFKEQKVIDTIKNNHLKYVITEQKILDNMMRNNQGIIVEINEFDYASIDDIKDESMILILDHLEDPHNFGAIIRTCEAKGIKSIIIPKDRSVMVNETVMKTSSGALNHVNIIRVTNLVQTINNLKEKGYFIYSAEADGAPYKSVDYADKVVLVIGSEGKGVSRIVKEKSDEIISIPMRGCINSLNASVAAAILIYGIGE